MRIKYNTNNSNGALSEQLKINSVEEAVNQGLAESIGYWGDDIAAFQCSEGDQANQEAGYDVVLTEVCE